MCECACGGARDRVGEGRGAAFGDDDSLGACGERRADDGAQVVGVFHAVEQDDDATVAGWIGVSENVFERAGGACGDDGDDALVIFGVGEAVELAAVFEADGDALFSCELNNFFYVVSGRPLAIIMRSMELWA